MVASSIPGTTNYSVGGEQAANFVRAYNAEPPETDLKADRLIVLQNDRISSVYVFLIFEGCIVDEVQVPTAYFRQMLNGIGPTTRGS